MALSDRLTTVTANRANKGCATCGWKESLTPKDRDAFHAWLQSGKSVSQLHELCFTDPDNPLPVSLTGLRNHIKRHES